MAEIRKQQQLKILLAKKEQYFTRIQRLYDSSKLVDNAAQLNYFRTRYETLENTKTDLLQVVDDIHTLEYDLNPDYVPSYQILETFDELYCYIQVVAKRVIKGQGNESNFNNTSNKAIPRLPKLHIPSFSGDLKDWPIFIECFNSLIHNNKDLNDIDRVHYLIGSLSGNALNVCSGIPPTGDNYRVIYQALVDKFSDKRDMANTYLEQLFTFKQAQTETVSSLNTFLEKFDTSVRALQKLDLTNLADYILTYLAISKLSPETQRSFENNYRKSEMPSYQEVLNFIKEQAKICSRTPSTNKPSSFNNSKSKITHSFIVQDNLTQNKCRLCKINSHFIAICPKFLEMSPTERYKFIRGQNLCLNCLGIHKIINCKSKSSCKICKLRHHSLLHFKSPVSKAEENSDSLEISTSASRTPQALIVEPSTSTGVTHNSKPVVKFNDSCLDVANSKSDKTFVNYCSTTSNSQISNISTVLLSTAKVYILDSCGKQHVARFLLDSCSQANFLTLDFCKRIHLNISKLHTEVRGIGASSSKIYGRTNIVVISQIDSTKRYPLEVLIVDKITNQLPQVEINRAACSHLVDISLADNNFDKPNQIDGIIGAELYPYLLGQLRIIGPPKTPVAVETSLGFVVMGTAPILSIPEVTQSFCTVIEVPLETLVKRFWEIEDIQLPVITNPDDIKCEQIFQSTYSRNKSGRYIVTLPFQRDSSNLGDSYAMAHRRFLSLEKKFIKFPDFKNQYVEIINDYLSQGHMTKVLEDSYSSPSYYIPHHAIYKPDSSSTPLRIVFDASAKTDTPYSLNDLLYTGPKLQVDVVSMFLNFRLFQVAFIADLRQMYRQIIIDKDHRRFQRILWRFSPTEPVSTYELNTVSFGIRSSPFLALRTIHQLANDEEISFPLAAEIVRRDMYIDDLVSSISTVDQAILLYSELVEFFARGGFDLVKWATNSEQLLQQIPEQNRSTQMIGFDNECLKVLGLQWHTKSDMLSFSLKIQEKECTKRNILSTVARCFDPLGFLSPVILQAKLLIKRMWLLRIGWDEMPPADIVQWWRDFQHCLKLLVKFQVPRYLGMTSQASVMLVGFADACETSYGAMVYIRIKSSISVQTNLLCAKTKLSPVKIISIPRLELCAAHLLAKLLSFVEKAYTSRLNIEKIVALSDSTVTLSWINAPPCKWKTFVANRVSKIQALVASNYWFHVDGKENISDCLSRGMSPSQFMENKLWLSGPKWLKYDISCWPIKPISIEHCTTLEKKTIALLSSNSEIHPFYLLADRCSSWMKLLRAIVYVLRFVKILPRATFFAANDLDKAEIVLLKVVQTFHFSSDLKTLEKNGSCSSYLRRLRPFMHDGILRVGGRLVNSKLNFDVRHPILLPKRDRVIDLLIDHYHRFNLHTGPNLVLSLLRQRYWILSARGVVRYRIQKCNICFKLKPKAQFPLMGNLPSCHIQESKAFLHTGVDYCGPIQTIPGKTYLDELHSLTNSKDFNTNVATELSCRGINWKVNPPSAPHFGGLWESNVKSVKSHLFRVIGHQLLTYEEMNTLLIQIEALLNSRPLCVLSSDPAEPLALTPAHFLTLTPLKSLPAQDLSSENVNRLDRFQLIDRMISDYWKRWSLEYLTSLQTRQRWTTSASPIKCGTIVLVEQSNSPPLHWPLGTIVETFPGKDGEVRVVSVKTQTGIYKRPVVKVYPLPTQ